MGTSLSLGSGTDKRASLIERGLALHQSGKFREAEHCYQLVLRDAPEHARALHMMGLLAIEAKKNTVAIGFFTRAVAGEPKNAVYRNNLGNALLLVGKPEEALPHLKKSVSLEKAYTDALCNLGRAYRLVGDIARARRHYEAALKADKKFTRARLALAELALETGDLEAAASAFERILGTEPGHVRAVSGLVMSRKCKPGDPLIREARRLLDDAALDASERVLLHHALGKLSNDIEDWEEAIYHFVRGKEFADVRFHMDLHRRTYAQTRTLFSKTFLTARPGIGVRDERPVFIVGMPRSGTTLTEQIIASHSQAHGLGELPNLRQIARFFGYGDADPARFADRVQKLDATEIDAQACAYLATFERAPKSARRITDKNPHNYEHIGLIALMFPKARIVHCRRDPMDTCVSCFMQNFNQSHGYNVDLATLGAYYREYWKLMEHWRGASPLPMFELCYEELIAEQEPVSRALIEFLGLDWQEACLRYFETTRVVATPSRWQVRQPIYTTSTGRWRRYGAALEPLRLALGDLAHEGKN